jgi:hypothetical protein
MGLLDDLEKHIYAHFYEIPEKVSREKFAEVAMKLGVNPDGLRLVTCLRFSCYDLVQTSAFASACVTKARDVLMAPDELIPQPINVPLSQDKLDRINPSLV